MKKTTYLTILCIVTLIGIGLARTGIKLDVSWFYLAVCISLATLAIKKFRLTTFVLVLILVFSFLAGWLRGSNTYINLQKYNRFFGQNVSLEVTALEDAVYGDGGQLSFKSGNIFVNRPETTSLIGELSIEGFGTPAVYKGDILSVEGKLYKKRGGQQGGISYAKIKLVKRGGNYVDKARRSFAAGMQNSLPEPLSSFGLGLLIGQRNTLSENINQVLIATGLIHIVAVSGYNLTIIVNGSKKLLSKKSRYQSLVFSLLLIGIFLLSTGNAPSIVRAAIVSLLSLIAWYFGRKFKPLLLICLPALITAFANPLYLWGDIGWYLSFSAFFGVLVLAPLLNKRFVKEKNRDKIAQTVLGETISAQIMTLPIILAVFGRLSVVSVVANVLVVPLVPLAMLLSVFAGISGMSGFLFSGVIALPAKVVLSYMLSIPSLLSKIQYANIEFSISIFQMMLAYAFLLLFIFILHSHIKRRSLVQ